MSPNPRFDVPLSGAVAALVHQLHGDATRDGRGDEYVSAFRTITSRLRAAADTFGEELFDLPRLGLTVRVGCVLPLSVRFTVHPTERLVTVITFEYIRRG
jgi:hypothetical protein